MIWMKTASRSKSGAALMACVLAGLLAPTIAIAQERRDETRRPLLVEGKKTLFQRVLTRPGAKIFDSPSANGALRQDNLPPFSVFYVFARKGDFVEIGPSASAAPTGFIAAEKVIDWKQTIVAAFNNPAGRERSLLFRNQQVLDDLIRDPEIIQKVATLRKEAASGRNPSGSPVLSIEPENHISIDDHFYILPILEHAERRLVNRLNGKVLRVAAVRKDPAPAASAPPEKFKIGVNFVIDTTLTMTPYIARVKTSVEKIQSELARANLGDRMRFGLVGFRQSLTISPRTEYHTRVFLPLDEKATAATFLESIRTMNVTKLPTPGWREDSLGGVYEGVRNADWSKFGARYIILVSDAGPRMPIEKNTLTNMKPRELNGYAAEQRVAIYAMHLRTPEGASDQPIAEAAYKELTSWSNTAPLYFGIENGAEAQFGSSVDKLVSLLVKQIQEIDGNSTSASSAPSNDALEQAVRQVGLAMQLAYLGERQANAAPDVFEAWVVDRDITEPRKSALDIRVFLTKTQLANLRDVTQAIIEKGENSIQSIDPTSFFQQLRSAVATMSRDPSRIMNAEFNDLGDAMGEFLQDLPYQSEVMRITEQRWLQMSGAEQRELIDRMKSKLALYEQVHNTPSKWVALAPGLPDGERVSAIPLSFMP